MKLAFSERELAFFHMYRVSILDYSVELATAMPRFVSGRALTQQGGRAVRLGKMLGGVGICRGAGR